jgi:hypothetical protein
MSADLQMEWIPVPCNRKLEQAAWNVYPGGIGKVDVSLRARLYHVSYLRSRVYQRRPLGVFASQRAVEEFLKNQIEKGLL